MKQEICRDLKVAITPWSDLLYASVSSAGFLKHLFSNTFHLTLVLERRDLRGEKNKKGK